MQVIKMETKALLKIITNALRLMSLKTEVVNKTVSTFVVLCIVH